MQELRNEPKNGHWCNDKTSVIASLSAVNDDKSTVDTAQDGGSVIDHLVEGDGKGGHVTRHDIGGGVSDQYDIDARCIEDAGKGIIVCSDHGDLLSIDLHFLQGMGRYFFEFSMD